MKLDFLRKYVVLAAVAAVFTLQSCSDDPEPVKPGQAGFYIVNEGGFHNNNTSISFYDRSTNTVTNDIFAAKNGRPLGDQSQSMTVIGGKGYVVVQGTKKIEVINADDYSSIATITDSITSPRYLIAVSATKAYVSDWGADGVTGTVKVLDLTTNRITKTIKHVGMGTNKLLKINNIVYAANAGSTSGDVDNTVTMIDTNTDTITGDLKAAENPNSLQVDKDGNLWVATVGDVVYLPDYSDIDYGASTPGSLVKIRPDKNVALKLYVDDVTYTGISHLLISTDGTQLYYIYNDAIYSMSTSATTLPTTPFKAADHYYGLAVDPFDGSIIGCKSPSFSAAGSIEIINPDGTVKGSFATGVIPNGVAFK
jgi:hypothetical protein